MFNQTKMTATRKISNHQKFVFNENEMVASSARPRSRVQGRLRNKGTVQGAIPGQLNNSWKETGELLGYTGFSYAQGYLREQVFGAHGGLVDKGVGAHGGHGDQGILAHGDRGEQDVASCDLGARPKTTFQAEYREPLREVRKPLRTRYQREQELDVNIIRGPQQQQTCVNNNNARGPQQQQTFVNNNNNTRGPQQQQTFVNNNNNTRGPQQQQTFVNNNNTRGRQQQQTFVNNNNTRGPQQPQPLIKPVKAGDLRSRLNSIRMSKGYTPPVEQGVCTKEAVGKQGVCTKEAVGKQGVCTEAVGKQGVCTKALGKQGVCTKALEKQGVCTEALGKQGVCTEALLEQFANLQIQVSDEVRTVTPVKGSNVQDDYNRLYNRTSRNNAVGPTNNNANVRNDNNNGANLEIQVVTGDIRIVKETSTVINNANDNKSVQGAYNRIYNKGVNKSVQKRLNKKIANNNAVVESGDNNKINNPSVDAKNVAITTNNAVTEELINKTNVNNDDILAEETMSSAVEKSAGVKEKKSRKPVECICLRPIMLIVCKECWQGTEGRISKPCLVHLNVTYLLDINRCPESTCHGVNLEEYMLPEPSKKKNVRIEGAVPKAAN